MKVKLKGFTLIELLTVVVVLGILSSVMLLSGLEMVSTAEVSNVISNLQNLRTAILLWYADNSHRVVKDDNKYKVVTNGTKQELADFITNHSSEITRYLENGSSIELKASNSAVDGYNYCFKALSNGKYWYIGYKFFKDNNDKKKDESFMKKFESRASSLNLLSIKNADNPKAEAEIFGADKDKYVYMLVLKLES